MRARKAHVMKVTTACKHSNGVGVGVGVAGAVGGGSGRVIVKVEVKAGHELAWSTAGLLHKSGGRGD